LNEIFNILNYYKASGVSLELHQERKVFSKTFSRRSSPVPSPSNNKRLRIISSLI